MCSPANPIFQLAQEERVQWILTKWMCFVNDFDISENKKNFLALSDSFRLVFNSSHMALYEEWMKVACLPFSLIIVFPRLFWWDKFILCAFMKSNLKKAATLARPQRARSELSFGAFSLSTPCSVCVWLTKPQNKCHFSSAKDSDVRHEREMSLRTINFEVEISMLSVSISCKLPFETLFNAWKNVEETLFFCRLSTALRRNII